MKKYALLLALSSIASADPAVKNVQINIHNNTSHAIEFHSFDTSRLFASTQIDQQKIPPASSKLNVIAFTSFDHGPISAGMNILIDGEPMKLMWQINMGYNEPNAPKSHLCGVIKDNGVHHEYCDIPYVYQDTLIVDFRIQ